MKQKPSKWWKRSWNPVTGCSHVSDGCRNCYAASLAATRLSHAPAYRDLATMDGGSPRWIGRVRINESVLAKGPPRIRDGVIFVCDMGDLFHHDVDDRTIEQVLRALDAHVSPGATALLLTKRAGRMRRAMEDHRDRRAHALLQPTRIWCGVTVENERAGVERIPYLLDTPCAGRFVSCEPLLSSVKLEWAMWPRSEPGPTGLDWVVVGGEAGPTARPCAVEWITTIVQECKQAGVPCFVKQLGSNPTIANFPLVQRDRRGTVAEEWPECLRVRETPFGATP